MYTYVGEGQDVIVRGNGDSCELLWADGLSVYLQGEDAGSFLRDIENCPSDMEDADILYLLMDPYTVVGEITEECKAYWINKERLANQ